MATFVQCTCAWTWGGRRRMRRANVEREEVGCARASSGYGRALGRGCDRISLCAAMTHASAVSCTSSATEYEDRQAHAAPPLIYRSPMSSAGREGSSARHHERSGGQPRGAPSARSSLSEELCRPHWGASPWEHCKGSREGQRRHGQRRNRRRIGEEKDDVWAP
jgi:hypothetical protein